MRTPVIIFVTATTLIASGAQAQPWRNAQPHWRAVPFMRPMPGGRPGPWGFGPPQQFRMAPALPFTAPRSLPPTVYSVPHPYPRPPFVMPVPFAPGVPSVPTMPVQPMPLAPVAPPQETALNSPPAYAPPPPVARVTPHPEAPPVKPSAPMTALNASGLEPASSAWSLSSLPLKLLVPVAAIGSLGALYGLRRYKGVGGPKDGKDFAELPY